MRTENVKDLDTLATTHGLIDTRVPKQKDFLRTYSAQERYNPKS